MKHLKLILSILFIFCLTRTYADDSNYLFRHYQVYTDNVAPKEMKAQAQGLLFFLVWGIGFLIGTLWNGWLIGLFRDGDKCDWPVVFAISTLFSFVLLILFVFLFKPVALKTNK